MIMHNSDLAIHHFKTGPSIYHPTSIHHQCLPLENEHVLVLRPLVVEDLLHTHAEAVPLPQRGTQLREPSFLEHIHSP